MGQRQNQMAGTSRKIVDHSANWVRIISGASVAERRRTSSTETATDIALASATSAPGCRLSLPGRTITSTPAKPTTVAVQRRQRTFSCSTRAASTTENSGCEKASAVASASGSMASA